MPDNNERLADVDWKVGIHGRDEELTVSAAYLHTGAAADHSGNVTLKDADHKIVFQGTAGPVAYVRRGDPGDVSTRVKRVITLPEGVFMSPGQLADLQAAVDKALADGCRIQFLPPSSKVAAGEFWGSVS